MRSSDPLRKKRSHTGHSVPPSAAEEKQHSSTGFTAAATGTAVPPLSPSSLSDSYSVWPNLHASLLTDALHRLRFIRAASQAEREERERERERGGADGSQLRRGKQEKEREILEEEWIQGQCDTEECK